MSTPGPGPEPLTAVQAELYGWIIQYTLRYGYQPSRREMCRFLGCSSPNTVACMLAALEKKGWLRLPAANPTSAVSRALRFRFTPDGRKFTGFVLGRQRVSSAGGL